MFVVLYVLIVTIVSVLLFLNLYFRLKLMKDYNYLNKNRVEFESKHLLNQELMEKEILPLNQKHAEVILRFAKRVRFSLKIGSSLVVLISILGAILMYWRS